MLCVFFAIPAFQYTLSSLVPSLFLWFLFSFIPTDHQESSDISLPHKEEQVKATETVCMSDPTESDQFSHGNTQLDEKKEEMLHPSELVKYQLTEPHREMLRCQLYGDSSDIVKHFGHLRVRTESYLLKKDTSVERLVTCVMDLDPITYPGQPSLLNELKRAESISRVFMILVEMKLISFLQYDIVEHIIVGLCTESDELNEALQKYKDHFSRYVKVRVCESSLFQKGEIKVFDEKNPSCSTPHLIIVTDNTWTQYVPFLKTQNLRRYVVQIFGIQEFYLDLDSIDTNCLKLSYVVPSCMEDLVFPLTPEQEEKLREYGISEVYFGKYHYIMEEKGKSFSL